MEAKILKTVSPFLLAVLMVLAILPATAQRGDRNYGNQQQQVRTAGSRVNPQMANYSNQARYSNHRNVTRFGNSSASINVSFGNTRIVPATCAPVIRPNVVRMNYNNGHRVRFLPHNAIQFIGMNRDYFLVRGQFYTPTHQGYVATVAPVGIRVNYLPQSAIKVFYNRNVYYQVGNVLLAPIVTQRGRVVYELAGYI